MLEPLSDDEPWTRITLRINLLSKVFPLALCHAESKKASYLMRGVLYKNYQDSIASYVGLEFDRGATSSTIVGAHLI